MRARLTTLTLLVIGWGLFLLAYGWPTVALIIRSVADGASPTDGFVYSARQISLLARSVYLAAMAAGACLLFSLPGAYVVGRYRGAVQPPLIGGLLIASLLCPPMVYSFGWERLLPVSFSPMLRCIGVWALWAWPIPSVLLGTAWSRIGTGPYEAATLTTGSFQSFIRVALPLLIPSIVLSGLIVFVLFFGDYSVPHACGLMLFSTELLGWASSSIHPIDTAWPAMLPVMVTVGALSLAWIVWLRQAHFYQNTGTVRKQSAIEPRTLAPYTQCKGLARADEGGESGAPWLDWVRTLPRRLIAMQPVAIILGMFTISWLLPIGRLAFELASPEVIPTAFRIYGSDLCASLATAGLSGLLVVLMGIVVASSVEFRNIPVVWAVVFGTVPGALIGEALVAAYNNPSFAWIYDYWPIVSLCYVARFGWIGLGTVVFVVNRSGRPLVEQARIDGATRVAILRDILVPQYWPVLLSAAGIVTVLSLAEVAASSLVRVPSFGPISHILIEKFHRFEYDLLISLSFWLVMSGLAVVMFFVIAQRRWQPP